MRSFAANFVSLGRVLEFGKCFGWQVKSIGDASSELVIQASERRADGQVTTYQVTAGEVRGPYADPVRLSLSLLDGSDDTQAYVTLLEDRTEDLKPSSPRIPGSKPQGTRTDTTTYANAAAPAAPAANDTHGLSLARAREARARVVPHTTSFINAVGTLLCYYNPDDAISATPWERYADGDIQFNTPGDATATGVVASPRVVPVGKGRVRYIPDGGFTLGDVTKTFDVVTEVFY